MSKRLLLTLAVPAVLVLSLPTQASADASVRQDSCVNFLSGGVLYARISFTVINFSLPDPICDVHFIPEPQPPTPYCIMLDCLSPAGWSCFLNPFGGADWFANTPADCIGPESSKSGYKFILDPGYCCYVVQFTNALGEVILQQEECFCDKTVRAEDHTWGGIKEMYEH